MPEAPSADLGGVVAMFADLIIRLEIDTNSRDPAAELRSLVGQPWAAYQADPRFASPLTESGAPFEVSLQVDHTGETVLRYVVDTADRRLTLGQNLAHYEAVARGTTGAPDALLKDLFDRHLVGAPPDAQRRVMHGVGLARGGRRRASLYFPTDWLAPDETERRLARQFKAVRWAHALAGQTPKHIQVVGYDFAAQQLVRWKTYTWLTLTERASFAALADAYPTLQSAVLMCEAFQSNVPARLRDRALFLQLGTGAAGVEGKLFFFSRAWCWSSGAGLANALGFLTRAFRFNPLPLSHLRDATARHHFPVKLGLLAVSGDACRPSLTFYFWPR
jgi:hypothetical protein